MATRSAVSSRNKVARAAHLILAMFEEHHADFEQITSRARDSFERRDWKAKQSDAARRLDLYEESLALAEKMLAESLEGELHDYHLWKQIKKEFRDGGARSV